MIEDQLEEFETKSKDSISIWQILLEKLDIIPIGIYVTIWFIQKFRTYSKYNEQLFQEDDFIYFSILTLPILFWWLYSRRIKFGWFLRSTFYLLVSTLIIRGFIAQNDFNLGAGIVLGSLLIASSTIFINSFRSVQLQKLKIDNIILGFVLIVDITIILVIAFY